MIIRSKHTANFTTVPNGLVNDSRLSAEAVGVALYLLSKPPEWVVRLRDLQGRFQCGRDRVRRIIQELERAGYLVRVMARAEGKFAKVDFEVFDVPQTDNPQPGTENPATVNPATVNPALNKERGLQNIESTKSAEGGFENFWGEVPRRVGKGAARTAYRKAIKKTSPEIILTGIRRYARENIAADPKYICHPAKWLNSERWADEPPRPKKATKGQLAG